MDDFEARRRRPVATYGKRGRKRLSGVDDVFLPSPTSSRLQSEDFSLPVSENETADVKRPQTGHSRPESAPSSPRSLQWHTETTKQTVMKEHFLPLPRLGSPVTVDGEDEGEDERDEDDDAAAAARQLLNEAEMSRKAALAVFDIPTDSDDDRPSANLASSSQALQRNPLERSLSAPKNKLVRTMSYGNGRPRPTTGRTVQVVINERPRPKREQSKVEEVRNSTPSKSNADKVLGNARISKPAQQTAPKRAQSQRTPPTPVRRASSRKPSVSVPPELPPATPQRSRSNRARSRHASVAPPDISRGARARSRHASVAPIETKKSKQTMIALGTEISDGSQSSQTSCSRQATKVRKPQSPRKKPNPPAPPKRSQSAFAAPLPVPSFPQEDDILPEAFTVSNERHQNQLSFGFSDMLDMQDDHLAGMDMPPPRIGKRLVDSLGFGTERPRKKSRSASPADDSQGSPLPSSQGSLSASQDYGSQLLEALGDSQNQYAMDIDIASYTSEPKPEASVPARPPLLTNGRSASKVTYARQRSYRADENMDELAMLSQPLLLPDSAPVKSGRRLLIAQKRAEEEQELDLARPSTMMKSIHELRASGGNSQFLDDVEELFADMEQSSLGRQRSGCMELASKTCDKSFMGKFRTNSFEQRLFSQLHKTTDEIMCFALAYLMCFFLEEDCTPAIMLLLRSTGAVNMLSGMLMQDKDILSVARNRKTNMSKATQASLVDLVAMMLKSPMFAALSVKTISPHLMALKALELLVKRHREAGMPDELISAANVRILVRTLEPFTGKTKYTGAIALVELPVSILEAHTVAWAPISKVLSPADIQMIANLVPTILSWERSDTGRIIELLLRLSLNMANNEASVCDSFADSRFIPSIVATVYRIFGEISGAVANSAPPALDLLNSGLSVLLNMCEHSAAARAVVNTRESGEGEKTGVDLLMEVFISRLKHVEEADSLEEAAKNVPFGFLSVLLGNLCHDGTIRRKIVCLAPQHGLLDLQRAIEEFNSHNRKLEQEYIASGIIDESYSAFIARIDQVVDMLRKPALN